MRRALALARRGLGRTSPNPAVGAVVVRGDRILGEGYHLYERRKHAEVLALEQAGDLSRGADLYITLEPCCHQGRTPPCTDAILAAGIRRVWAAVSDPNPQVGGKGIRQLVRAGLQVHVGLCEDEATELNRAFFKSVVAGIPLVTLKLAMSLDGRIATSRGESKWITGESSRRRVHRMRFESDAILVGVGTVLADDPQLNVRGRHTKSILKVILDSQLRSPENARLLEDGPALFFHSRAAGRKEREQLESRGATLVEVPADPCGLSWSAVLSELGQRKIQSLLVEGGGKVAASALSAGVVDRVAFFYGPLILGGDGKPAIAEAGIDDLSCAPRLESVRLRRFGSDALVEGRVVSRSGGIRKSPTPSSQHR
jgi:diaminohydroxyphosphoribosylaminopyrimidine deaminase / 5-amino-6-(5-phosphoribosylamino)uracil reductase